MAVKVWIIAAALALSACGSGAPTQDAETAAPAPEATNALDRMRSMGADLAAIGEYVRTSAGPECGRVFRMEDRGIIPATIGPEPLRAHIGARAFDIHCAPLGQDAKYDGTGQMVVIFPPDTLAVATVPCRTDAGADICWKDYSDPSMQAAP
ncbi:MAG: hypothetical protein GC189_10465 [Alphaproteobacteria bacterium]|nr:hypothetical protein [Alphaproteobacteria bacterium]